MGCTASKLDNEDTVRRCKERRRLMKEAVFARHHLAAAHADYLFSLRRTGSSLSSFAHGEPLSVAHNTPAVFLHSPNPTNPLPPRVPSPSPSPAPRPTPTPPAPAPAQQQQQPRMMAFKSPSPKPNPKPKPRGKAKPKLPHILSESSFSNSSMQSGFFPSAYQAQSTYSSTPSQASSVWNWENFYPPSPPDSDFFDRRRTQSFDHQQRQPFHEDDRFHEDYRFQDDGRFRDDGRFHVEDVNVEEEEDTDERTTEYDYFDNRKYRREEYETEAATEAEREREEVQCSDWGDHYSTTSSSEEEEQMRSEDGDLRSEIGTRSNFSRSMPTPAAEDMGPVPAKSEDAGSSAGSYRTGEISLDNMKMVVRHKDLKEIVDAIKENFEKAAAAGNQVSEMLEIGRAQLDRSFRQLKSE